jgi:predicted permease
MYDFPVVLIVIVLALMIFIIAAMWKIYEKASQPGWAAIVPFYNLYVLLKIVGKPGWWLVLFLIPLVNYVFIIWTYNMLSKSFGKEEGFTVGLVLLGIVFFPILGFGDAKYIGPYGDKAAFDATSLKDFGQPE